MKVIRDDDVHDIDQRTNLSRQTDVRFLVSAAVETGRYAKRGGVEGEGEEEGPR